jgi:predicted lipid-binding transport protein (Tim44 family)
VFDIYTIIFLALAVFIFLRLRSVLGQRTGEERQPFDRAARDMVSPAKDNNVVPLPGPVVAAPPTSPATDEPPVERWKGVAEPNSDLARGLDAVLAQDSSFDVQHFVTGARAAYEMIVLAFAHGDRRTLKDLLSSEVYDGFAAAFDERERKGEVTETRFIGIDKAELTAAEARGRNAQITMRFISQMVSVTRNKAGDVVDGSPDKVSEVTDIWTFARDTSSRDPNWKLVGTEGSH